MVLAVQSLLLGNVHLTAVAAPRVFSSSSPSPATRARLVRLRASSSSPESAASANAPSALDIPSAAPATSTSLVSRTPEIVQSEGIVRLGKVDHYKILKVPYKSTTDEITRAFKDRCEEVTSQQKEGDDEASKDQLRALQVSFEILTSEEERRVYDWVLQRYFIQSRDKYIWPFETDITQRYVNKEPPPVMRSFDEEGNNRVGLFFLGWLILSIIFSLSMKTWVPFPHYATVPNGFN